MRTTLEITGQIKLVGANPFVLVSGAQAAVIQPNWRRPMLVRVMINGQSEAPWRTNMMPTGQGDFLLYFHGGMRKASHTQVHDVVTIELSFDQG